MKHLRSVHSRVAALATILAVASLMGCMELLDLPSPDGPPSSDSGRRLDIASVTVRVSGPLTIASAKGGHDDVDRVTVTVARDDSQGTPLETDLTRSAGGAWTGTLSGLATDTSLTFTAQAYDSENTVIFSGTHTATLDSVGAQITIRLNAVDDGDANRLAKVTGISISSVSTGVPAQVTITVQGSGSERLEYEFAGGTFDPPTGEVTLSSGTGNITSTYQPPSVPGWYTAQIALRNAQGNRVEVDFRIRVQTAGLTANLGPAVRGLTGKRTPAGIRWTARVSAGVSAAGDGTGLTYEWTFTNSGNRPGTFSNAATNPTILTSYTASTAGTLSITVSDAAGLSTTASLNVVAGMFSDLDSDLMPAKATLLVNEIDYDQDGSSDLAEFVEILNPGSDPVDLADYRIELVDGADGEPYQSFEGTGQLAAGGFLVIADKAVIDGNLLPNGTPWLELTGSGITNGPDGIRIVAKADGRVIDAVHYERVVPGSGEGSPAPEDSAEASTSIGRCPAGFDSDDNGLDFRTIDREPGRRQHLLVAAGNRQQRQDAAYVSGCNRGVVVEADDPGVTNRRYGRRPGSASPLKGRRPVRPRAHLLGLGRGPVPRFGGGAGGAVFKRLGFQLEILSGRWRCK